MNAPLQLHADTDCAERILADIATATALTAQMLAAEAEPAATPEDSELLIGLI